jgi:iron(III) transport system substrate-binding protein
MKKLMVSVFSALLMSVVVPAVSFSATELLVYTAVEADELKMFQKAFEKQHKDIKIKWVRDSTGIMTSKLMAEANNPKADIVWGLAASSLMVLDEMDYFEPYAPAGLERIDPRFRDPNDPPTWVGQRAWIGSVCYNVPEGEKNGVPQPASWADLLKPEYKGHVVMPNPNSSGTGYLDVSAWLQMMGEQGGWEFMDQLHENIAWYTHSGSKPCKQAAAGETVVGVSFAYRGAQSKQQGAPIEIIAPIEGVGWDIEAFGIVKGAKNMDAAKVFADWSISDEAMELYNKSMAVVAVPGIAKPVKFFPEQIEERMIDNDFAWAASNRIAILDEWRKRYDGKSEAK